MILNIRNGLVVFIAIALAAAVLLVTGRLPLPQGGTSEEYVPYSSIPEFPSINETDNATIMKFTTAFLESSEWSEEGLEDWNLADVAPLTYRGFRVGVYAEVQFGRQLSLPGPLDFIRCYRDETWVSPAGEFEVSGLHIWVLDGSIQPYHVLPLNQYGELPSLQDVASFVTDLGDCIKPLHVI